MQRRSVIDDDSVLAAIAKVLVEEWPDVRRQLIDGAQPLLIKRNGALQHVRLTEEIERAAQKSATAQRNGAARRTGGKQSLARRSRERTETTMAAEPPVSNGSTTRERTLSSGSAEAGDARGEPSSEGEESQNETKNEIEITTTVVDTDSIGFVLNVISEVVPHLHFKRDDVASWLDEFPDAPWIAAAICESELSLKAGRHPAYVLGMLREKSRCATSYDDPLGYVRFRLNSLSPNTSAADAASRKSELQEPEWRDCA